MEGFYYNNIFDTKGIEYLVVIAFLLMLIPFWLVLTRKARSLQFNVKTEGIHQRILLRIPEGIYFSKHHTWAFLERQGIARIGLDDLLLKLTGDIRVQAIRKPGEFVRRSELLAEIHRQGKCLQLFSPIGGEIKSINKRVSEHGMNARQDPYQEGWIYEIQPNNWQKESGSLLLAGKSSSWINSEFDKIKEFILSRSHIQAYSPGLVTMQDGGEFKADLFAELPADTWRQFQEQFLEKENAD